MEDQNNQSLPTPLTPSTANAPVQQPGVNPLPPANVGSIGPVKKSRKLPMLIGGGILASAIVVAAVYLIGFHKSNKLPPAGNSTTSKTKSGSANQSSGKAVGSEFVYDITHNQATTAYKLTAPDTGLRLTFTPTIFAANVQNLSNIFTGQIEETSYSTSNAQTQSGSTVPIAEASYSIETKTNQSSQPVAPGKINLSLTYYSKANGGNNNWLVTEVNFSTSGLEVYNDAFTN